MVNKRRYNSVERFTSLHLSESEQRQQLRPTDHWPIGTNESSYHNLAMPTQMPTPEQMATTTSTAPSPSRQQQMAHPFSLIRRRSHEQLQIPTASPQALLTVSPAFTAQKGSAAPSFASSSLPYAQRQYPQKGVQPVPHSQSAPVAHSTQPLSLSSSSPPFLPLQIRPQQGSLPDTHTIRHSSAPRGDEFDQANVSSKNRIPPAVWATLSVLEVFFGVVSLFVGALNANPYNCIIQPNVPIYLILSGLLLILNGAARLLLGLYASPSKVKRRNVRQIRRTSASADRRPLVTYAVEGVGLLAIVVVLLLGSVWVYGASRYMHSQLYMFERHFCEQFLYWFAWWSVTIHLALLALLILLGIVALIYGATPGRK